MTELTTIKCHVCGAPLKKTSEGYCCRHCDSRFTEIVAKKEDDLLAVLNKEKQEYIANRRQLLWEAINEKYLSGEKIIGICREIRLYLPDDFMACFFEAANDKNPYVVSWYLSSVNKDGIMPYRYIVADWFVRTAEKKNILTAKSFITKTFSETEHDKYIKYVNKLEELEEKLDEGVFNPKIPRDVFIAYSSKDTDKVVDIVEYLESQKITCYVALRNLRQGRRAKERYNAELYEAMKHCKCVVFVSTENSRDLDCDALDVELPYIQENLPEMGRIHYVTDRCKEMSDAVKLTLGDFFEDRQWTETKEDLLARILKFRRKNNLGTGVDTSEVKTKRDSVSNGASVRTERTHVHEYKKETVPATCITHGYTIHKCTCGDEYHDSFTELSPHNYGAWTIKKRASCTESGEETRSCFVCGDTQTKTIPAVGHKFSEWKLSSDGIIEKRYCANCGTEETRRIKKDETTVQAENGVSNEMKALLSKYNYEITEKGIEIKKLKDKSLKEAIIPDGVTSIGDYAFLRCYDLTSVIIPDSVTSISDNAFSECNNLRSIEVDKNNDSYTSIKGSLYSKNGQILFKVATIEKQFIIPKGVTSIGKRAFEGCSSLTSVIIPASVTSIGDYAFLRCYDLTSVIIPDSVTRIGECAFGDCSSLKSLIIPDSVTSIGDDAFIGCNNLRSIDIDENNDAYTSIKGSLYSKNGQILFKVVTIEKQFIIPKGVTSIGRNAFEYRSSLTSVTIPASVTSIGDGAFRGCKRLTSIFIPASVTNIGDGAFGDCSSLKSLIIPDGVTSIGKRAFYDCEGLTSIVVPKGVTSIGDSAFRGCKNLTSIVISDRETCSWGITKTNQNQINKSEMTASSF